MRHLTRHRTRSALVAATVVLATAMYGCGNLRPYPALDPGVPASTLVFDNQIGFVGFGGCDVRAWVDGFDVSKQRFSWSTGGSVSLSDGRTVVRVPGGSHEIKLQGRVSNPYFFNPVAFQVEVEEGKTYTVRLRKAGRAFKPGYSLEYEGWLPEQWKAWPTESFIANALF